MENVDFKVDKKLLASRIKQGRKGKNLTQEKLGELLAFDQKIISAYERALHTPQVEALAKMSLILDVSIDWLIGLSDNPTRN